MSPWQVEALEKGDYARLPRGTFLRGFVRNYAKTLGLAPESVLKLLADASPRDPTPGIVVPHQNIRFDPIGDRLASPYVRATAIASVAVVIGFAAMYWWLFIRPAPPAQARKPAAENVAAAAAAVPAAESPKAEPIAEAPKAAPLVVASAPASTAPALAAPQPKAPQAPPTQQPQAR